MTRSRKRMSRAAVALLCSPLWLPFAAEAASDQEIEDLRRAIQELKARNDALSKRLSTLEAERSARKPAAQSQIPSPPTTRAEVPPPVTPPAAQPPSRTTAQPAPPVSTNHDIVQRATELEITKRAQEDAVRSIIQDSLSKVGPKINDFVTLG